MEKVITSLENHLLIATEQLKESYFEEAVIYVCRHDEEGAMGLVVNSPMPNVTFDQIAEEVSHVDILSSDQPIIFRGGPVESNRGFVLHGDDYEHELTMDVGEHIKLTATIDVVDAIANGKGPKDVSFCLGYSGWSPGQLEKEVGENNWLVVPADENILFNMDPKKRYEAARTKLGFDASFFVDEVGRA